MPTPPRLSEEQRRQAYQKSLHLRRERAAMKAALADGSARLDQVIPRDPKTPGLWHTSTAGMKVYDLLVSLPGIGRNRALKILWEAGIIKDGNPNEKQTVRACGPKQRARLFAAIEKPRP